MFTRNGISDSLLDAVKGVAKEDKEVSQYQAFGLTTEKKNMDPVGKGDADIDNDGDEDESDEYLHKRRKAIKKSMGKEKVVINPNMKESENAPSKENGGIAHMCASHVQHATYGEGVCIPGEHTIVETAAGEGYVTHYDVIFDGTIVEGVSVDDLKIIKESSHKHMNASVKKDKKKMIASQKMKEEYTHDDFKKDRMAKVKSTGAAGRVIARHRQDGEIHYTLDHGGNKTSKHPGSKLAVHKEETKVASGLENPHNCATHVYSESYGAGQTVPTMHAVPDTAGNIAWYDVMFEHGIEKGVPIEEMKVVKSESHMHSKKKG